MCQPWVLAQFVAVGGEDDVGGLNGDVVVDVGACDAEGLGDLNDWVVGGESEAAGFFGVALRMCRISSTSLTCRRCGRSGGMP